MESGDEGIFLIGDSIKEVSSSSSGSRLNARLARQVGTKQWYAEMELEPLEETGLTKNFRVKVGDDVIVDSDEHDHSYVIRVTELFRDESKLEVTGNLVSPFESEILRCSVAVSIQGTLVLSP